MRRLLPATVSVAAFHATALRASAGAPPVTSLEAVLAAPGSPVCAAQRVPSAAIASTPMLRAVMS